jgi:hypothetical protein
MNEQINPWEYKKPHDAINFAYDHDPPIGGADDTTQSWGIICEF